MSRIAQNPLVRGVGRIPTSVQSKLLAAFAIVVILLVAVGVLGIGVLSQSNNRVETLALLQKQLATYRVLSIGSDQISEELADRGYAIACPKFSFCLPGTKTPNPTLILGADGSIQADLDELELLTDPGNIGFTPQAAQLSVINAFRNEDTQISNAVTSLIAADADGRYTANAPEQETVKLEESADQLVSTTNAATASLTTQNQTSFLASQHLFIAVAAVSAVLALLLGVILSWALVEPIKQIRARLASIGSGDFSGYVEVPNRDELGVLAADLNRMNDELGRLYRQLEDASKHKSEFLANMSHELRTPLNAVIGFSEVLEDRLFGELNDKQAEYVADIRTSGRHLLTLINDILDLSKIEAGRMELQVTSFALADVVQNSVALLRERATRQGIALGSDVHPDITIISADERMLKQVLFNLLSNALKFTPRGGHVDVSARGDGNNVTISVRDDGVGIATVDQARIFEEFAQVGTSALQEGTGLGLAISRRFAELHGGSLSVVSESGRGSTFTFTFPRTQDTGVQTMHQTQVEAAHQIHASAPRT